MFRRTRYEFPRLALFAAVLLLPTLTAARADDTRDRSARVALALAADGSTDRERQARAALAFAEADPAPRVAAGPKVCPCGCGSASCSPAPNADVARLREAVVRVRCGNSQGSGTVVWSDRSRSVVLTAAHVVAGDGALTVRGNGRTYPATLLGRDEGQDLAALLVAAELPAVCVSAADPARGAAVTLVGVTSLWSKGQIGDSFRLGAQDVWDLTYDSDSGDSGGGVFAGGELVGVHCGRVGSDPSGGGKPYCTRAKPIRAFLSRVLGRDGPRPVAVAKPAPATAPPATYYYAPSCPGGTCPTCPYQR